MNSGCTIDLRRRLSCLMTVTIGFLVAACSQASDEGRAGGEETPPEVSAGVEDGWTALFNGRDLTGWTPKITGFDLGQDPLGTFRVEDGVITVGYENYDVFEGRFGHLFYAEELSDYVLRVEYRFTGDQAEGGPGWAFRNSGVMLHAQDPASMMRDQEFPVSIEAQFLGGSGEGDRPTANLCTPGTHVVMQGELVERHCTESSAPTFHGDGWVTVDLVVMGGSLIAHVVEGDTVLEYSDPVVGGGTVEEFSDEAANEGRPLTSGYIALQAESHPVQFRKVWMRRLPGG